MMCIQASPYTDHQCIVGFKTGAFAHGSIFSNRKHIGLLSQVTMLLQSRKLLYLCMRNYSCFQVPKQNNLLLKLVHNQAKQISLIWF